MCCGKRRSAWLSASAAQRAVHSVPAARQSASNAVRPGPSGGSRVAQTQGVSAHTPCCAVMLEYLEVAPIRVWGPVTGQPYDFSGAQPLHAMDARDAVTLARSGLFRRTEAPAGAIR